MKKIVVATGNKDKVREISTMLTDYQVISQKEAGFSGDIVEDGATFYENALIKAKTVSMALGVDALADDSGISVDALNGEPGIYSARYSEEGTNEKNNEKLLKNLEGVKNRKAKFCCALVLYKTTGEIISAYGETEGEILLKAEGENGFGYDPIFYSYDLQKSLGIASDEEKNTISHRARALKNLLEKLKWKLL